MFDFMDFSNYFSFEFDKAFKELEINKMLYLLKQAIQTGCVEVVEYEATYGLFPTITAELEEAMEVHQLHFEYKALVVSAIEDGLAARVSNHRQRLPQDHFDFLFKNFLRECFIPKSELQFLNAKFRFFHDRFPERVPILTQALRNYLATNSDDKSLIECISQYTAGQVVPDQPKEWMKLLIKSVETGQRRIP